MNYYLWPIAKARFILATFCLALVLTELKILTIRLQEKLPKFSRRTVYITLIDSQLKMGKFYETTTSFNYAWNQIVEAFWKRYPNPHSTHILSEDTIFREIRDNRLYTRRLLTKSYRLPKWGQRFVKSNKVPIMEESYIDPMKKIITTYTRNIGYTRLLGIVEKVTYTPDPNNPQKTTSHRSTWMDSSVYGIRRAVEKLGIEKFRKNCKQTTMGFKFVLNMLYPNQNTTLENGNNKDDDDDPINVTETTIPSQYNLFAGFRKGAKMFYANAAKSPPPPPPPASS